MDGIAANGPNGCVIPPSPTTLPPPTCPPYTGPPLTMANYQALGLMLAPKVYMHPLEWWA